MGLNLGESQKDSYKSVNDKIRYADSVEADPFQRDTDNFILTHSTMISQSKGPGQ